jgi:hypothetical protein
MNALLTNTRHLRTRSAFGQVGSSAYCRHRCHVTSAAFTPATSTPFPHTDLFNLDRELAPYPFDDSLKKWLALTNHISEHTLKRYESMALKGDNFGTQIRYILCKTLSF